MSTAAPEQAVTPQIVGNELLFGILVFPEPGDTELQLQLPPSEADRVQTFQLQVSMVRLCRSSAMLCHAN